MRYRCKLNRKRKILLAIVALILVGLALPQHIVMPVKGAGSKDYNSKSFWYYPWGRSVTHKGVDIFATEGTPVVASTPGLVVYSGELPAGGNVVVVLGPKWRIHYYAHLKEISTTFLSWADQHQRIGTVGTSGNAAGKPPHLHYSIATLLPYPWRIDRDRQGWKKMFFLNPIKYLKQNEVSGEY